MSCHGGTHHICDCQRELLDDAIDALAHTLAGIEKYIASLPKKESTLIYTRFDLGIESARSVLRRARNSK